MRQVVVRSLSPETRDVPLRPAAPFIRTRTLYVCTLMCTHLQTHTAGDKDKWTGSGNSCINKLSLNTTCLYENESILISISGKKFRQHSNETRLQS